MTMDLRSMALFAPIHGICFNHHYCNNKWGKLVMMQRRSFILTIICCCLLMGCSRIPNSQSQNGQEKLDYSYIELQEQIMGITDEMKSLQEANKAFKNSVVKLENQNKELIEELDRIEGQIASELASETILERVSTLRFTRQLYNNELLLKGLVEGDPAIVLDVCGDMASLKGDVIEVMSSSERGRFVGDIGEIDLVFKGYVYDLNAYYYDNDTGYIDYMYNLFSYEDEHDAVYILNIEYNDNGQLVFCETFQMD